MTTHNLFALDAIEPGTARKVTVDGRQIALVRLDDDVYAIGDTCSHADVSLSEGFVEPDFAGDVARTGWTWGTTAFDFDNDGDRDLFAANGHISGVSSEDYCSTFWTHDLYTGGSEPDPTIANLFALSSETLRAPASSRLLQCSSQIHSKWWPASTTCPSRGWGARSSSKNSPSVDVSGS